MGLEYKKRKRKKKVSPKSMAAIFNIERTAEKYNVSLPALAFRNVSLRLPRATVPPRTKRHEIKEGMSERQKENVKKKNQRARDHRTLVSGIASRPLVYQEGPFSARNIHFPPVTTKLLRDVVSRRKLKDVNKKLKKKYPTKRYEKRAAKFEKEQAKLLERRFKQIDEEKGRAEAHLFLKKQFKLHFDNATKIFGAEKVYAILEKAKLNPIALTAGRLKITQKCPSSKEFMKASKLLLPFSSKATLIKRRSKRLDLIESLAKTEEHRKPIDVLAETIQDIKWKLSKKGLKPKIKLKDIRSLEELYGIFTSAEMLESVFNRANIGYSSELKGINTKHLKHLKKLGVADEKGQPTQYGETSFYRSLNGLKCNEKKEIDKQTRVRLANISKDLREVDYNMLTGIGGFNLLDHSKSMESALMKKRILDVVQKNIKTPFWEELLY